MPPIRPASQSAAGSRTRVGAPCRPARTSGAAPASSFVLAKVTFDRVALAIDWSMAGLPLGERNRPRALKPAAECLQVCHWRLKLPLNAYGRRERLNLRRSRGGRSQRLPSAAENLCQSWGSLRSGCTREQGHRNKQSSAHKLESIDRRKVRSGSEGDLRLPLCFQGVPRRWLARAGERSILAM